MKVSRRTEMSLAELDRQYVQGYRRKPEDPEVGKMGAMLAAEVWPNENWDDVWKSWLPQQPTRRRKKPRR